jgi:predicted Zn-dependent peptidase
MVLLGFQAPPEGDEDRPVADLLVNLLGGDGGWLQEQVEQRQGLAACVAVAYRPRARAGALAITAWTSPENETRVLEAVQGEIKRVTDTPLLYKDYRSALNAAIGRDTIEKQVRLSSIRLLTELVLAGKGLENFQDYPARLQEVSQDDLPDLARRILNVEKSVTVKLHGRAN